MAVTIRGRRDPRGGQGQLITVEDWGVGMEEAELAAANALLAEPPEVDLSVSKRLGFHVVARLAKRHGIRVVLSPTPGSGVTASIALPGSLFELGPEPVGALVPAVPATTARPGRPSPRRTPDRQGHDRPGTDRPAAGRPTADRPTPDRPVPARSGPDGAGGEPAAERAGADVRPLIPSPRTPLPAETGGPGLREVPEPVARSWTGWWAGTDPASRPSGDGAAARTDGPGVSTPRSIPLVEQMVDGRSDAPVRRIAPLPTPGTDDISTETRPTLRRRVPQAHLAPGLRIIPESAETPADPGPLPVAAEALSRYQASRAAARSLVDDDTADERSTR
jgi:hypothetical protein